MMYNKVSIASFAVIGGLQIIGIFMLLWVINFYRLRNLTEISARRPKSSVIAGIICTIATAITAPGLLLFLNIESIPHMVGTRTLLYILANTAGPGLYHVLTFRAFIIYFDIKFNEALEDTKWRLHIDPAETNWFLKNRNLWGNHKRIAMLLFIHWVFWLIVGTILTFLPNRDKASLYTRATLALSTLAPTTIDCILYCKFPKFNDVFHISDEIKLTLKAEIIEIIIFYIAAIALNAQPPTYEYIGLQYLPIIISFIFASIIFLWVLKKFSLPSNPCYVTNYLEVINLNHELSSQKSITLSYAHSQEQHEHKPKNKTESIHRILQSKHGFNAFARHLTKEFCIENLLFVVETQQWLQSLIKDAKYMQFAEDELEKKRPFSLTLEFPETAPKSLIIQETTTVDTTEEIGNDFPSISEYLQCVQLFDKYIKNSAYFMININSESRIRLYQTMGYSHSHSQNHNEMVETLQKNKLSTKDLFYLYDGCRQQIYTLLTYAYSRFKRSDEYTQLHQKLH
eukprot:157835_1